MGLLVAMTMLAFLWAPATAEGGDSTSGRGTTQVRIPRYDKSQAQCRDNRRCLRDYRERKRCRQLRSSYRQKVCLIRYAARYYGQDPDDAVATAKCESGDDLDPRAVSPGGTYKGHWQFDRTTWRAAPHSKRIVRTATGAAVTKHGRVQFRRRSRFSVKYTALGAMWYWRKGERERWPVCG